ncbi:TPA: hypothetical protein ACRRXU_002145 [Morganella morganii]|uniref:hypothetical protein n=1 Tax=Morganella morganii TaxID=582 RepID=UPI003BA0A9DD
MIKPIFIAFLIFFSLFFIFAMITPETQGNKERRKKVSAIELCWKKQEKKSLSVEEQRFIALICEKMEDKYRNEYGRNP